MKIYIAHSGSFDYKKELYEVLEKSNLAKQHVLFFPESEENKKINTKNIILEEIDIMIAEISFPATGLGIELGRAEIANIPLLCLYRKGTNFSGAIHFITKNIEEYNSPEQLINKIKNFISNL